jgi:hypothetical protein
VKDKTDKHTKSRAVKDKDKSSEGQDRQTKSSAVKDKDKSTNSSEDRTLHVKTHKRQDKTTQKLGKGSDMT